jgi:serine/threonine protein kinase
VSSIVSIHHRCFSYIVKTGFYGTTSFASSEILRGEPYQAPPADIWALGVLLSILVTGECPFVDTAAAVIGKLTRPKIRMGNELRDLLLRSCEVKVASRITIDEMMMHPWLTGALDHGGS